MAYRHVVVLAIFVALASLAVSSNVGIEMNLALDYGVVSISFANGTQVDIAKIEGSIGYKQMMRAQKWMVLDDPEDDASSDGRGMDYDATPQDAIGQRSFRGHLPCWIGGSACDRSVKSLAPMLQALKVAASSYLGTSVTSTIVVFPVRPSREMLRNPDLASSRASLRLKMRLQSPAGQLAAYANGMSDAGCRPLERRILTVEYSRAALTTMMFREECGIFEDIRSRHNETLGAGCWSSKTRDATVTEFRRVARKDDMAGLDARSFDALVLLGELGDDQRLGLVLKEAFASAQEVEGLPPPSDEGEMVAPLFAASRGAALASLRRDGQKGDEARIPGRGWLRSGSPELR